MRSPLEFRGRVRRADLDRTKATVILGEEVVVGGRSWSNVDGLFVFLRA